MHSVDIILLTEPYSPGDMLMSASSGDSGNSSSSDSDMDLDDNSGRNALATRPATPYRLLRGAIWCSG